MIVLLATLVISNFIIYQNAFAYTISFNPLPPLLTRVPTLCAVEPNDPNLSNGQLSLIMEETQNRVLEWPPHLQEGMPFLHNWDIKYTDVTSSISQSFNYTNCDIVLALKGVPDSYDSSVHNALGYEYYDPSSAKHLIVVFYENYYYYKSSPYDTSYSLRTNGYVPPLELGNVILHETGHALGLNHYTSDDNNVNAFWSSNPNDAPSIMIPFVKYDPQKQFIQKVDVDKLHEIYGLAGFTAFSPKIIPNPFDSLNASPLVIQNEGQQNTVVNIVGYISYQYYNRGNQVEIIITNQNGVTVFDQSFLTTEQVSQTVITDGWPNGIYTVKAKYGSYDSQDIQFVKSDSVVQSVPTPASPPSVPQQSSITGGFTIDTSMVQLSNNKDYGIINISGIVNSQQSGSDVEVTVKKQDGTIVSDYFVPLDNNNLKNKLVISKTFPTGYYNVVATYQNISLGTASFEVINGITSTPEFGSMASVVLPIAFISIIVIFAKMRLLKTSVD
ncbi:MAG TPA: hypothetical protein VGR54_02895 [Nitrosopumilaceae archaeon]|nr:hypothetical protein [Nitrosopumilaceae archaeon]